MQWDVGFCGQSRKPKILRVQNEQSLEEKGFILRNTEKEVHSFRRDSNP